MLLCVNRAEHQEAAFHCRYMLFKFTDFVEFEEWALSVEGTVDEKNNVSVYISAYYQVYSLKASSITFATLLAGLGVTLHVGLES